MRERMSADLKHSLGPQAVATLAEAISRVDGGFESARFQAAATTGLEPLALKVRVAHVATALEDTLTAQGRDFTSVAALLSEVARAQLDPPSPAPPALRGFAAWPLFDLVPRLGLEERALGLETLRRLTPLFSAEFAVRPFLARWGQLALDEMTPWATDPNEHVRRLFSEGTRTRLPWATRVPFLSELPGRVLPLLTPLASDPSLYVRKSVANHLNDVSRDDVDCALATARVWLAAEGDPSARANRAWVVKHALRTRVKAGDGGALALLGHGGEGPQRASLSAAPVRVPWSGTVTLEARLEARGAASWVVDWALVLASARGAARRKVMKWTTLQVDAGEAVVLRRTYAFKPITTRVYYPGAHAAELLVNGQVVARADFVLGSAEAPEGP
jgi:3-methyladenine DNA glycosylase AlkC